MTTTNSPAAGATVVGFFRAEFGQGEVARRLVDALEWARIPHSTVTVVNIPQRQEHPFVERQGQDYATRVLCLNAEHMVAWAAGGELEQLLGKYSIGVWFWETSTFPEELHPALDLVDEVWVASDFVADAIAGDTWKPVLTFPLPVEVVPAQALGADELGLPEDAFVFLFVFDFYSTIERKNPLGLIEAFKRSFPPGSGAALVLKSINGDKWPEQLERLQAAAAGHPDIRVLDGFMAQEWVRGLTARSDCYVSLHRSEGFGLTIAEAMAYGKPAIATGYSGNLTFMDEDNSYLVPYTVTTIPDDCPPYPPGGEWADPDLVAAGELMRRVFEQPDEARERGERGREAILKRFSVEQTAAFLSARLPQIERLEHARSRSRTPARRAREFLVAGPATTWEAPSRFGGLGRLYRRFLMRLLRPYLVRQREFELAVAAGLEQVEALGRHNRDQVDRLERIARRLAEQSELLESRLEALDDELYASPYTAAPLLVSPGQSGKALGVDRVDSPYRSFEDLFRGPEQRVRGLQSGYVELLADHGPVLDVGAGRGEFLDLLAEAGIEAVGVDLDEGMVAAGREKGHDVELADAVSYLERQPEGRFGAIFASHVLEHLGHQELERLFELARAKLAPGGLLVAETVNPHSLRAFKTFWTDPTHRGPLFPEVVVALALIHGFATARVLFPGGSGNPEEDRRRQTEYALVAETPAQGGVKPKRMKRMPSARASPPPMMSADASGETSKRTSQVPRTGSSGTEKS